ncbi:helix-turn-helix transcriptional regulator [Xinfangfangia sp. D13-10-4-6]|uniref:helix-turn-helix domain-containing protein n=1 Tax=Pseudogemmobacter hezensis TaxID=2737662 RepID=UPI001557A61D|nr:helix-turn-helix transcriptional regulator [Pseudogemmobacter hezensis]NPD16130.1 helix-turn-helix transcriptional regulator [Pseudogemmobacter hezensis]
MCGLAKSIYDEEYRGLIRALKDARKSAGLTQQDVADKLDRPQSFVAKVEGCERRLDVVEFLRLCRAIGISPAAVLREA